MITEYQLVRPDNSTPWFLPERFWRHQVRSETRLWRNLTIKRARSGRSGGVLFCTVLTDGQSTSWTTAPGFEIAGWYLIRHSSKVRWTVDMLLNTDGVPTMYTFRNDTRPEVTVGRTTVPNDPA